MKRSRHALLMALADGELGARQSAAIRAAVPEGMSLSKWLRGLALRAADAQELDVDGPDVIARARLGGLARAEKGRSVSRRIYLASSWRNPYQPALLAALKGMGHLVYDFRNPRDGGPVRDATPETGFSWRAVDPSYETAADKFEPYRGMLRHPVAKKGFTADFDAMKWADTCVLLLPCGRSAHLEAGWMCGKDKRLIVYMPQPVSEWSFEPELMYLIAGDVDNVLAGSLVELKALLERE